MMAYKRSYLTRRKHTVWQKINYIILERLLIFSELQLQFLQVENHSSKNKQDSLVIYSMQNFKLYFHTRLQTISLLLMP